ncbi:DUF3667 domain-containing protein [Massilia sp. H-1]|nr:DUF3667 domain-containing protein [Massilia sp. H-1]
MSSSTSLSAITWRSKGACGRRSIFCCASRASLSAEYIDGRRKRYVEPLRVYLTFSILFFFVLKLMGPPVVQADMPAPQAASAEHAAKVRKESVGLIQLDPGNDIATISTVPGIGPKLTAFMARLDP